MKDIRKEINEANEIAKFMNKDIHFEDQYISKFDDQSIHSNNFQSLDQMQDEV